MRWITALLCAIGCTMATASARAAGGPGNPDAIGTSRTIVVDPAEHNRLGSYQYPESLPLADKEVVLTFDDGPLPHNTNRILDILSHECVKATFFMVGRMASSFPKTVRRVYEEGHNVASHSQNHPYGLYRMAFVDAAFEIDEGFNSLRAALGDASKVTPFFRFPGLHRQDATERY